MDTKSKLRALGLALAMVAAAAGTGWALQLPLTATVEVSPGEAARFATPAEAPQPGLSVLAWPHPAVESDEGEPAQERSASTEAINGLEEMSATGAAAPGR